MRGVQQAVQLSRLNGDEAEHALAQLAQQRLPIRMKQPQPVLLAEPAPAPAHTADPVQQRIEQLLRSLDIEGAAPAPAVSSARPEPPPKPALAPKPAQLVRPPSAAVSGLSQAPTALAAAQAPSPPRAKPAIVAVPPPQFDDSTELFCYAESLANDDVSSASMISRHLDNAGVAAPREKRGHGDAAAPPSRLSRAPPHHAVGHAARALPMMPAARAQCDGF